MWRKLSTPEYNSSRFHLTPDQRIAVAELVSRLEADPSDEIFNPVIVDSNTREIEVAGVWVRYRLRPRTREIVFLRVGN